MNKKIVAIVLILLIALVAGGVYKYWTKQNTIDNQSNLLPTTVATPSPKPVSNSAQQIDVVSLTGWSQPNSIAPDSSSNGITVSTPKGTNWYYLKNENAKFTLNSALNAEVTLLSHGVQVATDRKISHIHFVNDLPLTKNTKGNPPDEVIVTIDSDNSLLVGCTSYASLLNGVAYVPIIKKEAAIQAPTSGHIKVQITIASNDVETLTIIDGDSGAQLMSQPLPLAIFSTKQAYVELSVENNPQDPQGAIMNVSKFIVSAN